MIILHILNDSIPYTQSGYAIRSHSVLSHQKKIGIEVYGLTLPGFPNENGPLFIEEIIDGVSYIRVSQNYLSYRIKRKMAYSLGISNQFGPRNYRSLLKKVIKRVITRTKPHIIHIHSLCSEALAAVEISKRFNIPIVYELRGLWEESEISAGLHDRDSREYVDRRAYETVAMQKADHIVTICHQLKMEIINRGIPEDKVSVISNGVDLNKFYPVPRNIELASRLSIKNNYVIGYISTLRKLEGVEMILKALPIILKDGFQVKALIVGDGPELTTLKKISHEHNLSAYVVFTGNVPHSDILDYYSIIDIFVVPRLDYRVCRLVTPLKPYEAMAMKKALIVSDLPALKEMITNNETGLTFEAGNPGDLANKILALLKNKMLTKNIEEAAYEFVLKNKDWNILVQKYKAIYSRLLQVKKDYDE